MIRKFFKIYEISIGNSHPDKMVIEESNFRNRNYYNREDCLVAIEKEGIPSCKYIYLEVVTNDE
jgi:hypothetical protein